MDRPEYPAEQQDLVALFYVRFRDEGLIFSPGTGFLLARCSRVLVAVRCIVDGFNCLSVTGRAYLYNNIRIISRYHRF